MARVDKKLYMLLTHHEGLINYEEFMLLYGVNGSKI